MSKQRTKKKQTRAVRTRVSALRAESAAVSQTGWSPETTGAMVALMLAAFVLRVGAAFAYPSINFPDEIFQVIEQAHRAVFGTGFIPWEFEVGTRSWVFPGMIAIVMEIARIFSSSPGFVVGCVTMFMAAASLTAVACGFLWGFRVGGTRGGIVVGFVNGIWAELVYFSTHTLSDVMAGDLLIAAIYLGYPDGPSQSRRRIFWAGVLFGLVFVIRVQLTPAIGLAVIWICWRELRARWIPMIGGALAPIIFSGLLDLLTWHGLFRSMWRNVWMNLGLHIAEGFGVVPRYWLALEMWHVWGWATLLVVAAMIIGGRRLPLLLAVALTVFLTHSSLTHQEYRFLYPAIPIVVTLLGVAVLETSRMVRERREVPFGANLDAAAGVAIWCVVSYSIAVSSVFGGLWTHGSGQLAAFHAIAEQKGICGVGLLGVSWLDTPGYSHLPSGITVYQFSPQTFVNHPKAANAMLVRGWMDLRHYGYRREECFGDQDNPVIPLGSGPVCLWTRAGSCVPGAILDPPVNWPRALIGHENEWIAR
ncbi:MAG: glycosyltransferase family protein [Candidatus Binataceae bacterium]